MPAPGHAVVQASSATSIEHGSAGVQSRGAADHFGSPIERSTADAALSAFFAFLARVEASVHFSISHFAPASSRRRHL